jgi:hypothetical protein
MSGGAVSGQRKAFLSSKDRPNLRFEVNAATKLALKMCGSKFSVQFILLERSRMSCRSGRLSSVEIVIWSESSKLSTLFSPLELKGLKASPILTERGRNPRRLEIEPAFCVDESFESVEFSAPGDDSSAIPWSCAGSEFSLSVASMTGILFRTERVSTRLEGLLTLRGDNSEMLALVGELGRDGDVLVAPRDILLTMFLIIRGEDHTRSSLFRLGVANCEEVGVTGTGDLGLRNPW